MQKQLQDQMRNNKVCWFGVTYLRGLIVYHFYEMYTEILSAECQPFRPALNMNSFCTDLFRLSLHFSSNDCWNIKIFLFQKLYMMLSWLGNAFHLSGPLQGNPLVTSGFPLTHWPLRDLDAILKLQLSILFYWLVSSHCLMIMPEINAMGPHRW